MRQWKNQNIQPPRFMAGRYGVDPLGRFLSVGACAVLLLGLLLRGVGEGALTRLLGTLALCAVAWCYFRVFSKNISRRAGENQRYLALKTKVLCWLHLQKDCFDQRRDYSFYRCPGCHQMVRVPKRKGRIRITCPKCGFAFEKKT